ncbi:MAG: transglycosylase SLT domain-containing protein [Cellvibrionaceae bacterium]
MKALLITAVLCLLVSGCVTSPPQQVGNICSIFDEKSRWYKKAKKSEKRWGSPISTMMAMMHQESRFRAKAKPPRTKILWIIPGPRKSDAYGYPQAKDSTWAWYKKSSGNRGADRDDFGDAIDFIGWYNVQTNKKNRVSLDNTRNLYLAYHEGHGGYARATYRKKGWLVNVANKVDRRATTYKQQLQGCEKRLNRSGFSLWPF